MLPELFTPEQTAIKLNLFKDGEPNTAMVKRLANDGKLECVNISKNYKRFTATAIQKFIEDMTCQSKTEESTLNGEKTKSASRSSNTLQGGLSDTQLALKAVQMQKKNLRK